MVNSLIVNEYKEWDEDKKNISLKEKIFDWSTPDWVPGMDGTNTLIPIFVSLLKACQLTKCYGQKLSSIWTF